MLATAGKHGTSTDVMPKCTFERIPVDHREKLTPYKYLAINGQWLAPAITVPQC